MTWMTDGYLDDIFDALDAHCHPCILMGRYALLWMGANVIQDPHLDLLIRNSQFDAISAAIPQTGTWFEIPFERAHGEDYLQPSPRIFERKDGSFAIKVWSEEAAHLLVDPPSSDGCTDNSRPFLIEALCCEALNAVLLESDMHPGPEISPYKPRLLTAPDIRFLPNARCQSASRQPQSKVFIPTISRYLDALFAQQQWLMENEPHALRGMHGPDSDISHMIRYLFLEMPSQREKILPLVNGESRPKLEDRLDRYKRTYKKTAAEILDHFKKKTHESNPHSAPYENEDRDQMIVVDASTL